MYRPLLGFKQSVPNLVVGVQSYLLDHYSWYDVGNVHNKFKGCTVDVQATTGFLTIIFKSGLYINCTTLKLLVYITYTAWSVMVQSASLYTYNKIR